MAAEEAYMLKRDDQETKRLNFQHEFLKVLGGGLIHPSIPLGDLHAVADIATGTGVWLEDVAKQLTPLQHKVEYVGFDISADQFPREGISEVSLEVHDASKPFPSHYQAKFDLVNVRFLSYAIKVEDMQKLVDSIAGIIRPGGYLQWQEIDAIDTWSVPETQKGRDMISFIVAERMARGLPPAIVTPLITAIRSGQTPVKKEEVNTISWSEDTLRLTRLDMISTQDNASDFVQAGMKGIVGPGSIQLLSSSVERQNAILQQNDKQLSAQEREILEGDVRKVSEIITALQQGQDPASNSWHTLLTWIVARKALPVDKKSAWMSARHSS